MSMLKSLVDFTQHRYAFEGFAGRLPYLGSRLIALSDRRQLYLLAGINVIVEAVTWWMSVGRWTTMQAEAGARSWRSMVSLVMPTVEHTLIFQVIATISIMLAPAFALLSTSSLLFVVFSVVRNRTR
jgi:hypothetical protein